MECSVVVQRAPAVATCMDDGACTVQRVTPLSGARAETASAVGECEVSGTARDREGRGTHSERRGSEHSTIAPPHTNPAPFDVCKICLCPRWQQDCCIPLLLLNATANAVSSTHGRGIRCRKASDDVGCAKERIGKNVSRPSTARSLRNGERSKRADSSCSLSSGQKRWVVARRSPASGAKPPCSKANKNFRQTSKLSIGRLFSFFACTAGCGWLLLLLRWLNMLTQSCSRIASNQGEFTNCSHLVHGAVAP